MKLNFINIMTVYEEDAEGNIHITYHDLVGNEYWNKIIYQVVFQVIYIVFSIHYIYTESK